MLSTYVEPKSTNTESGLFVGIHYMGTRGVPKPWLPTRNGMLPAQVVSTALCGHDCCGICPTLR